MKNSAIIYILIGAVTVLLLWQFLRVRSELVIERGQLKSCQDSLNAVKRDTLRDTVYRVQLVPKWNQVPVPDPIYVVDTYFVEPSFARYEDSVVMDSMVTIYYRLNVQGSLLSQGYRYRAMLPEIHTKELIYLPGEAIKVSPWSLSAGAYYGFDQRIGVMAQGGYRRAIVGYGYSGAHQVSLLYRLY